MTRDEEAPFAAGMGGGVMTREEEAPFAAEALLEQLVIAVLAVDQADRVRGLNSAAERMLDRPRRHLLGMPMAALLPGHPLALDLVQRARRLAMPCRARRVELSPSPHRVLWVSLTAVPLLSNAGEPYGALLQLEEVGAAEHLVEGERLHDAIDSLGSLALSVAHEVKNPLAGIRGAAQLLEMRPTEEAAAQCTRLIRSEVDRVSRLLDSLLGLADAMPLQEHEINIHQVLDHVVELAAAQGGAPIRDYDPSLPPIRGDRDRLVQLFLNLVKNAREAAGAEGRVTVTSRISQQVRLMAGRRCQHVVVTVEDDGPGVPAEMTTRIFMPFVTTKSGGTGLGLAICQKIAHDHGGLLELESRPGCTRFKVFLPLTAMG